MRRPSTWTLILGLLALGAWLTLRGSDKPTFEAAVTAYYRAVAVLNADQIQLLQLTRALDADKKTAQEAAEALKTSCVGTLEGMEQFRPTCKPKPAATEPEHR